MSNMSNQNVKSQVYYCITHALITFDEEVIKEHETQPSYPGRQTCKIVDGETAHKLAFAYSPCHPTRCLQARILPDKVEVICPTCGAVC